MSKQGVKDLLESIEPNYATAKIREEKQLTIAASLPTDTEKRESVFKRGINTLKKGINRGKKGFKQSFNTMKKGVYKDYTNVKEGFKQSFNKGVKKFTNFRDRRKQMSEEAKAEKTRIFNENRRKFLDDLNRIQELSNGSNTVDSFRDNINEILNYTDRLIAFKNKKRKRLQNDSEFSKLVSNIAAILIKAKRFSETSIGTSATEIDSINYKRIEKLIRDLNTTVPDESDSDEDAEEESEEEEEEESEPEQQPTPEPPPPPPSPPPSPPPPSPPSAEEICQEKLSVFNVTDKSSYRAFMLKYHPDKGFLGKESEINSYVERFPSIDNPTSMEEKQTYIFQDISECADRLQVKEKRGGSRKIVKKKKKVVRRTRKLSS
jgi:hypothetical protein